MKKHLSMVATIILCMSTYAQETKKDLPLPAREIVERMDKEILAAKQKAIQGLTKVLSDVVKTGNLEAANKVKSKLEEITSETAGADANQKQPWYVCKWTSVYNPKWIITLNADGTAKSGGGGGEINTGKWSFKNGTLSISWKDGVINYVEITEQGAESYKVTSSIGKNSKWKPVKD